jgi:hypothetical protein
VGNTDLLGLGFNPNRHIQKKQQDKGKVIKHMYETEVIKKHVTEFTRSHADPAPPSPFEGTTNMYK